MYDAIYFWEGIDNGRTNSKEPPDLDNIIISVYVLIFPVFEA